MCKSDLMNKGIAYWVGIFISVISVPLLLIFSICFPAIVIYLFWNYLVVPEFFLEPLTVSQTIVLFIGLIIFKVFFGVRK